MAATPTVQILLLMTCMIGTLSNSSLLVVLLSNRKLLKQASNILVLSMIVSDFLLAAIYLDHRIKTLDVRLKELAQERNTHVQIIGMAALVLILLNLVALTVERFIAIKFPFQYRKSFKRRHIYYAIALIWTIPTIWAAIAAIMQKKSTVHSFCVYTMLVTVPCSTIVLLVSNVHIFVEAHKQIKAVSHTRVQTTPKTISNKRLKQEMKAVYICFGLTLLFIVSWLPSMIAHTILYFTKRELINIKIVTIIWQFSPVLDPILYVVVNRDLRDTLKKTCV